ncbi:MAG: DUF1501 domain-containing protein [Holophagaceae bacterium]|nr:DUF1501 domain-containing protein [Holophagaceae bacterium]
MTNRRDFIQSLGLGAAALAGLTACGGGGGAAAGPGSGGGSGGGGGTPPPAPANPILILVQLDGGNDLLDSLVPISGPNAGVYATARPTLRLGAGDLADIGSGYGLPNTFTGMAELHRANRIAWIPGLGMPNPTLSHFLAMDLWSQGSASPGATGWLGRWADGAFDPSGDPLRGISTDGLPLSLQGQARSFVNISSPDAYRYPATRSPWGGVEDADPLRGGFHEAFQLSLGGTTGMRAAIGAGKLYDDAQTLFTGLMGTTARTPSVPYPGDRAYADAELRDEYVHLAYQLKFIAEMIAKNLPTQVFVANMGGFDTHSNHRRDHGRLLKELGGSLDAFMKDLAAITTTKGPALDRVLVMSFSEFGRRVHENNGGTDHGTAGLGFLLGKGVKGGFYGDYPNLGSLDENGNLRHTTDFRSLYATVLERWLGANSRTLLGATYPLLGAL